MDYQKLIERLRNKNNCNVLDDIDEAATAIETLLAENHNQRDSLEFLLQGGFQIKAARLRELV